MRVIVTFEERFIRTQNGHIHSRGVADYAFLSRYLSVFDQVIVLARIEDTAEGLPNMRRADGPNIRFYALPYYLGPTQFIKKYRELKSRVAEAVDFADAYILRVSSAVGTVLWRFLMKKGYPYGIEVVADPWDALSAGSVKTVFRPILRCVMRRQLYQQCRYAAAASYVTKYSLQKRYPPGGWSTSYSSLELPSKAIVSKSKIRDRLSRSEAKDKSNDPYVIGFVGNISTLYKAPDILISAVADCVKQGVNLKLAIVGDGQSKWQLKNQARQLGIENRVIFRGSLPPGEAVFNELDKMDLYVLPSRQEGLPRSVIEAMARGLPCIGSNVGGFPELLGPDEMVCPNDVKSLSEKIISVLSNFKQLEKMSWRNLETAKEYIADKLQARRMEFYKKVKEAAMDFQCDTDLLY